MPETNGRKAKMGTKIDRLILIKQYIKQANVRTQEQLLEYLLVQGYEVTQATVSRDITELGLRKNKAGYYILAEDEELQVIFRTLVRDVISSANIVLVKTAAGAAQTVARFIDSAAIHGILGSVAGDDTIFLLIAENIPSKVIAKRLQGIKE